eukprot:jgi/Pico_ML_1/51462/g2489.t1
MLFLPLDVDLIDVDEKVPDLSASSENIRSACFFQRSLAFSEASCFLACCTYNVPNAQAVPATATALHAHVFEEVDVLLSAMLAHLSSFRRKTSSGSFQEVGATAPSRHKGRDSEAIHVAPTTFTRTFEERDRATGGYLPQEGGFETRPCPTEGVGGNRTGE